ncbi:MAG TPA: sulfatase [Planctomycetaceae bacterium]|nr:sulfatase [Blastopirellula sp.]HAY80583.1 sulfatase [Planctomycetaceae bacterium]
MSRYLPILIYAVITSLCIPLTAAEKPNVLFISIDDLNNWVGYLQGHPQAQTPNLDRLAKRGVAFTNAHCTTPLCQPSRTAVLTGFAATATKIFGNGDSFDHSAYTLLPQYFAKQGYATYGTGKIHHKQSVTKAIFQTSYLPGQRWSPFDSDEVAYTRQELPSKATDQPRHVIAKGPAGKRYVLPFNGIPSERSPQDPKGESFDWSPFDLPDNAFGDGKITDWAIDKITTHDSDQPFFLAAGFYRPHIPLYAPQTYFDLYPLESLVLPETIPDDLADIPSPGKQRALNAVTAGTHAQVTKYKQWKHAVQAYLASISFIDHQVGRLLDCVDRSPHQDNTIIVLFSDHGWHLGEKQAWGKQSGWVHSTQVPLIICGPGTQTNRICEQPVSLLDLYPTLTQLAGLPSPDRDGVSLAKLLQDPLITTNRVVKTYINATDYVLSGQRWRYIRYGDGSAELYDIESDPREYKNLAGDRSHRKTIEQLHDRVHQTKSRPVPEKRKKRKRQK